MLVQIELLSKTPGAYLKVTLIEFQDLYFLVNGNGVSDMNQGLTSRKKLTRGMKKGSALKLNKNSSIIW